MTTMFTQTGSLVEVIDAWMGPANPRSYRWNCKGACKKCGAKTSVLGVRHMVKTAKGWTNALVTADGRLFEIVNGLCFLPCRSGCGRTRVAARVEGKANPKKECSAKCMAACGPSCECACGGKMHGSTFSL